MQVTASVLTALLSCAVAVEGAATTAGWRIMNGITGSFCLHSLLLPGNVLMCIERPHTHPYPYINPNTNGLTVALITIDPNAGNITYNNNSPVKYNAFCAGHSQAADGGVWVVGGDPQESTPTYDASIAENKPDDKTFLFYGIDRVRKFNLGPSASAADVKGTWDEDAKMTTARWYPTVLTQGDGTVFITSGSLKNIDFEDLSVTNNPTYEFYPPKYGPNIFSSVLNWAFPHNLYPMAFQLPSGKIFMMVSNRTVLIDPKVDPGNTEANTVEIASVPAIDHAPWIYPHTPTAFLMPMKESTGYVAEVVICGGSKNSTSYAAADCLSIQPDVPGAQWKTLASLPHARLMPEATILPDGTILFTNGMGWGQAGGNGGQAQYAAAPVFPSDLYDPVANKWTTVGTAQVARSYHNGAILLSDGSVITTGNEMANYLDFWGTPTAVGPDRDFAKMSSAYKQDCYPVVEKACTNPYEYRIEQFSPQYLFNGPRPIIKPFPSTQTFTYNSTISVSLDPSGAPVTRITLVRYTTTTHSTNTDQRLLEPTLLYLSSTQAIFRIPANPNLAVPGNWHLFALSDKGVPSVAERILIGAGDVTNAQIPSGPSGVSTAAAGTKSGAMDGRVSGVEVLGLAVALWWVLA
ncbi:hypothetical protein HDU79_006127 [Rhizoclosmatium sp. JEL0117]|nr:hypothetical protein HDU79_006127 [Rhizoclosmatium sp. JEL0117]